jgi:hypothetical protein
MLNDLRIMYYVAFGGCIISGILLTMNIILLSMMFGN